MKHNFQPLQQGDVVDIIAPGFGAHEKHLAAAKTFLESHGLVVRIPEDLLGQDLLSANSYERRLAHLIDALININSKAIWCLKGGYGTAELIPALQELTPPHTQKLVIGFSDITALHLFLTQEWGWQTVHGPVLWQITKKCISPDSIERIMDLLKGNLTALTHSLEPCNKHKTESLNGTLTGGNLKLLQTSIGTSWQAVTKDKILLIEEVDESAYRIDRTLLHMKQAGIFDNIRALLIGDMEQEPGSCETTDAVLARFAGSLHVPAYRIRDVGHAREHRPIILNSDVTVQDNRLIQHITP